MEVLFFSVKKSDAAYYCGAEEIEYIGITASEIDKAIAKLRELKQVEAIKDCFRVSYLWGLNYSYYDDSFNKLDEVDFVEECAEIRYYINGVGSVSLRINEKYNNDAYMWADILCLDGEKVCIHKTADVSTTEQEG